MFEDRSKSNYNFSKMDKQARTKVLVEEKEKLQNKNLSLAHKKLFGELEEPKIDEIKQSIKQDIIKHNKNVEPLENMPSSNYLKSFENLVVDEVHDNENDEVNINKTIEETKEINFENLIENISEVEINNTKVTNELKKLTPKPKKNYSFRIKLVAGVYCILVALFGGWIISNTINITNTNASLHEVTTKTSEVNANLLDIISNIKQLDNASGNPENESIVVKIVTEEIEITPETINEPNKYEKSSNWFDVFCNWIANIFGG